MAYEIYERNYREKEIIFLGINPRGIRVARELARAFRTIAPIRFSVSEINIEKKSGVSSGAQIAGKINVSGKTVIIVDDVMYSGYTLFYSVETAMKKSARSVQIAVLIDRGHRQVPVSPNYVGLELATTLQEHVRVELFPESKKEDAPVKVEVYLE